MASKRQLRAYLRGIARYHRSIKARGLEEMLLKQGVWFRGRIDSDSNEYTKAWRKQHRPKPKHCYWNAQMFCLNDGAGRYFEGYVALEAGQIVEHAWVVLRDGSVVDFTLEAMERRAKRDGRRCNTRRALYLGLEVPTAFVRDCMLRSKVIEPVAERYYLGE